MKYYCLFFVAGIFLFSANAQTIPLQYGAGNTYTYTEKDGIAESNVAFVGKDSKGSVYAQVFTGALYVIGNNYFKKINLPGNGTNISIVLAREIDGELFLFGTDNVYLMKNDTAAAIIKMPPGVQGYDASKPLLYFSCVENNLFKLYKFYKKKFELIHTSAASTAVAHLNSYDSSGNLYRIDYFIDRLELYKIVDSNKINFLFSIKNEDSFLPSLEIKSETDWYAASGKYLLHYNRDKIISKIPITTPSGALNIFSGYFLHEYAQGFLTISTFRDMHHTAFIIPLTDKLAGTTIPDATMQSIYFGSFNKPFRFFPYLKKHPQIFQKTRSAAVHAITQDSKGRIWAASYEGGISIIDTSGITEYREDGIAYLPNAVTIGKHPYFIVENGLYGLQQFDEDGKHKTIKNKLTGFYQYISPDKKRYYFGTTNMQCLLSNVDSLQNGKPNWMAIDSSKGYRLQNTLSVTEDTLGRLWLSHSSKGWAVYYPDKKIAATFLIADKKTDFGFLASYTDTHGTVWMGSKQKGLLYYKNYSNKEITPADVQRIEHPLFFKGNGIVQLTQWGKWLVIATDDKMLLMDLDAWYDQKKTVIRYLNPQETAFTAMLEQNTILTDKRDSSIWFATSNMLYQWDIKKWLSLPTFNVTPNTVLQTAKAAIELTETLRLKIPPTDNSLTFSIWFQSPDNMPRYMSVALIKKGDSLLFTPPSLQTRYEYNNLAPGNYELCIQICQQDGTVTLHKYAIIIKKFLWQQWWFWAILSGLFIVALYFFIDQKRKRQLAEQQAKTQEAELLSFKNVQEKKLANMQVVTLSNQFRPHFILNALNTIGAQMDDKPKAESVLSRLGESINLIFGHAQQQRIAHNMIDEWTLVKNIMHIHQLMYLKDLQVNMPEEKILQQGSYIQVPLGLLQIPVENALLHGLSNKQHGPWLLNIAINKKEDDVIVTITDNGVGRKKAATLSNYRKHGTGTKNLSGILDIVNANNARKITIAYFDDVFTTAGEKHGTTVIIKVPVLFNYEA